MNVETDKSLSVSERVCLAKSAVGTVPKNGYNKHGGYKHATVDDLYDAVRVILAEHNLDLKLSIVDSQIIESSKGTPWIHLAAELGFEGEAPQRRLLALPITGPQTYEMIHSYLQKQYLRARLEIPTGEYDEVDMVPDSVPVSASISTEALSSLNAAIEEVGANRKAFCDYLGVADLGDLREADHEKALAALEAKRQQRAKTSGPETSG